MKVKVKKVFLDLKEDVQRKVGEEFEVTEARFKELSKRLPDYISVVEEQSVEGKDDGEEQVKEEAVRKPRSTRKPK